MRVGLGYDIHPFLTEGETDGDKPLILGGVVFEGELGLKGHSDADVIAHAVADAILGAAGLGDMGEHFPDDDPKYKNADSIQLLKEVVAKMQSAGFSVANLNCVVIADKPKIAPQKQAIQKNLSQILDAPVSVGGKRTEGMGALGALSDTGGIACIAITLLTEK